MPADTARHSVLMNGLAVRAIRTLSGYNVSGLAKTVGIGQPHLSNIEAGRRRVSPEVANAIAKALDVPIGALLVSPYDDEAVA